MTIELMQTLSLASYVISGILFLVGGALFFLLDVPKLYGDVSGRTAKKAIEAIRQQNESTGNKAYKPSSVNAARGKLTDKITQSGKLESTTASLPVSVGTEKFATSEMGLKLNETTVLSEDVNETTVLMEDVSVNLGETMVLTQEAEIITITSDIFSIDVEMSFTGSSEIIE